MIRKSVVIGFFVFFSVALFAQNQAIIKESTGKVEFRSGTGSWQPARSGMLLPTGSYISTGFNSTAVLDIGGSILRVNPLTRMQIQDLAEKEGTVSTDLFLRVGKVKAEVKSAEGLTHNFRLRSPVSTAAVRGTDFEFDGVTVTVINGMVSFSNTYNQTRSVGGGEDSTTGGTDLPSQGNVGKSDRSTVEATLSLTGQGALISSGAPSLKKATVTVIWNW